MAAHKGDNHESSQLATQERESEINFSMGSAGAFDNSPLHLTVEKLNGKNYREWAQAIKLVIDGKWKAMVSYRQDSTTTSDRCNSIPKTVVRKLFHHLMLDQLHEVSHLGNIYVPLDGKGCVGCDMGNIL